MTELKNSKKRPTYAANPIKGNKLYTKSNTKTKYSTHKRVKKLGGKTTGLKQVDSLEENYQNPTVYRLMDSNGQALLPKPIKTIAEKPKKIISKSKRKQLGPEDRYQRFLEASNRNDAKIIEQKSKPFNKSKTRTGLELETMNTTWKNRTESMGFWNKPIQLVNNKPELKIVPKVPKVTEKMNVRNKPMKIVNNKPELKIEQMGPKGTDKINIWNKPMKLVNNKPESKIDPKVPKGIDRANTWNKPNKLLNKPGLKIEHKEPRGIDKSNSSNKPNKLLNNKPDLKLEQKEPKSTDKSNTWNKPINKKTDKINVSGMQVKQVKPQVKSTEKSNSMPKDFSGMGRTLSTKVNELKRKSSNPEDHAETKIMTLKDENPTERKYKNTTLKTIYSGKGRIDRGKFSLNKGKEGHKKAIKKESKHMINDILSTEKVENVISIPAPEPEIQSPQQIPESLELKTPVIGSNVKKLKEKFSKAETEQILKTSIKTNTPVRHTYPFQQIKATFENRRITNDQNTEGKFERSAGGASRKLEEKMKDKESTHITPRTELLKMVDAMRENLQFYPIYETPQKGANDDIRSTLKAIMDTRDKYTKNKNVESNEPDQSKSKHNDKNALSVEAQNLQRRAQTLETTKPLERAFMDSTKLENKLLEKRKIQEQSEFLHFFNKAEDLHRKSSTSLLPVEIADPRVAEAAAVFKEEIKTSFDNGMIKMAQRYSTQLENARLELSRRLNAL